VQAKLQEASGRPRRGGCAIQKGRRADVAVLMGKFRDPTGDRLTLKHTKKGSRRIRYYVSNRLLSRHDPAGWRLPAGRFEASVAARVADHLDLMAERHTLVTIPDIGAGPRLEDNARALINRLRNGENDLLSVIIHNAQISTDHLSMTFDRDALADLLQVPRGDISDNVLSCTAPFETRRRGVETRIVIGDVKPAPDLTMLRALTKAHGWMAALKSGSPISEIARSENVSEAFIRTRAQLACLSPRLQRAILDGTQPVDLTLEKLVRGQLPLDWSEQERRLGLTVR